MSIIGVIEDGEALTATFKHPDLMCVKSSQYRKSMPRHLLNTTGMISLNSP